MGQRGKNQMSCEQVQRLKIQCLPEKSAVILLAAAGGVAVAHRLWLCVEHENGTLIYRFLSMKEILPSLPALWTTLVLKTASGQTLLWDLSSAALLCNHLWVCFCSLYSWKTYDLWGSPTLFCAPKFFGELQVSCLYTVKVSSTWCSKVTLQHLLNSTIFDPKASTERDGTVSSDPFLVRTPIGCRSIEK